MEKLDEDTGLDRADRAPMCSPYRGTAVSYFRQMSLQKAVRLHGHIVHLLWVDGSYDMVAVQEKIKYDRTSGVNLGPVDYVKYAEAFGATGVPIQCPDDIAPTLRKAFDTPGPVLIGVDVDYSESVKLFEDAHESSIL